MAGRVFPTAGHRSSRPSDILGVTPTRRRTVGPVPGSPMTIPTSLARLLKPDLIDAGCSDTFDLLDDYVEKELADGIAAGRYPSVAAHLASCDACAQDFEGLRAAVLSTTAGP